MSDESPPPLRLKLRSDAAARPPENPPAEKAPTEKTSAEAGAAAGTEGGTGKLRLKPRLSMPAPSPEPGSDAAGGAMEVPPEVPPAPPPAEPAPIEPPAPPPRLELRTAHPSVVQPEQPQATEPAATPPPVPHVRAPGNIDEALLEPPPINLKRARDRLALWRRRWAVVLVLVMAALVWAGVYFAVPFFTKAPEKAGPGDLPKSNVVLRPPMAPLELPSPKGEPDTSKTTAAGQAVQRARQTAAGQAARRGDVAEATATGSPRSTGPGRETPAPSAANDAPGASREPLPTGGEPLTRIDIAPGIAAATSPLLASRGASAAFEQWVANVRISGVYQGEPARALIDGRMVRAGDTVNTALGIVFDSVEPEQKMIVLRDASGAVVKRKY